MGGQGRRKEREKVRRRTHEARCAAEDAERDAIAAALPAVLARALGVATPAASIGLPLLQPAVSGMQAPSWKLCSIRALAACCRFARSPPTVWCRHTSVSAAAAVMFHAGLDSFL